MKNIWRCLAAIIYILTIIVPLQAQQQGKLAQTGMAFLDISVGARAVAMGDAYVSVGTGSDALFWNPAGMAFTTKPELMFNYNQWIADINHISGSAAYSLGNVGVIGLSFISVDYGEIAGTKVAPETAAGYELIDNLSPSSFVLGVAFAQRVGTKFAFGIQAKYVRENLGNSVSGYSSETVKTEENSLGGLGFDFGTVFYTGYKDFRVAMSARNFSREIGYHDATFPMPLTFSFGVAMNVLSLMEGQENQSLMIAVDALHPRDYPERINLGAEYSYNEMFFVRAGYKYNTDEQGISGGFGIKKAIGPIKVQLDYAYSDFGLFDGVHRTSFGMIF